MNHFKETVYFILFLLIQTVVSAQGSWQKIDSPTDRFLRSVFFPDSLYGWIAGDSGTIYHTRDGGSSWEKQESKINNDIVDLFFLNRNLGWASSFNYKIHPYGTVLLTTTNGGLDWIPVQYPDSNIFITCILFLDSLNGWMGGRPHALVKTTDGGKTWHQADIDTSTFAFFPVLDIKFFNKKYGYACGGMFDIAGVIWRTSDGGDKWYAIDPSFAPADEVHALHVFDSLHVMGAGGDPDYGYGVGMISTSDGGFNWIYNELGIQGYALDLDFRTSAEAWAPLGSRRTFVCSLDTAATWAEIPTPDSTIIYDVIFPDSLHGFAVGKNGAVLKYIPRIIGSIAHESSPLNNNFILYQNYPNPFETSTVIRFRIPSRPVIQNPLAGEPFLTLKINVYNLFGEKVADLAENDNLPGDHEIYFNSGSLPPGIYFYKLIGKNQSGEESLTIPGKMILMR